MQIADDGKGFDVMAQEAGKTSLSGNGIKNIKKRAEELKGEITIDSTMGNGSRLRLSITI